MRTSVLTDFGNDVRLLAERKQNIKMSKKRRFVILDDEELENKSKQCKNKNTERSEKRANAAFTKFLEACDVGTDRLDYWNFSAEELDTYLAKFWFGARKDTTNFNDNEDDFEEDPNLKEQCYSANTLKNFRYALNRIIKDKGNLPDLIDKSSIVFKKSQKAFVDAVKELKAQGKAEIKSKHEITEEGKNTFFLFLIVLADNYSVISSVGKIKVRNSTKLIQLVSLSQKETFCTTFNFKLFGKNALNLQKSKGKFGTL